MSEDQPSSLLSDYWRDRTRYSDDDDDDDDSWPIMIQVGEGMKVGINPFK